MAAGDIVGGLDAELWLNGALIANGTAFSTDETHDDKELPTVFGGTGFKGVVKGGYSVAGKFTCLYGEGGANRAAILAAARSSSAISMVQYLEDNATGKPTVTMNVFIGSVSQSVAADGVSQQIDCTFRATSVPVVAPNIVLATQAMGSVAQSGAGSGFTTLSASGGTAAYTYSLVTQLPTGVTMNSSGVFAGTVHASCVDGTHTATIRVTDSAATPVVKDFVCTFIVA